MHKDKIYSFRVPPAKADKYSNPNFPENDFFLYPKHHAFG
jgi:hypothetical protein